MLLERVTSHGFVVVTPWSLTEEGGPTERAVKLRDVMVWIHTYLTDYVNQNGFPDVEPDYEVTRSFRAVVFRGMALMKAQVNSCSDCFIMSPSWSGVFNMKCKIGNRLAVRIAKKNALCHFAATFPQLKYKDSTPTFFLYFGCDAADLGLFTWLIHLSLSLSHCCNITYQR